MHATYSFDCAHVYLSTETNAVALELSFCFVYLAPFCMLLTVTTDVITPPPKKRKINK